MDKFQTYYADVRDPAQQPHIAARLRDQGLVTFSNLADRAALIALARRLMTVRPHRDADPDGVTVITGTGTRTSGGMLLSNTRWLHGRDRYSGVRIMLRILGDPLPGTNVAPGFPSPAPAPDTQASRAA